MQFYAECSCKHCSKPYFKKKQKILKWLYARDYGKKSCNLFVFCCITGRRSA